MTIYKDPIAEALNIRPIYEHFSDFHEDDKLPDDAISSFGGDTTSGTIWVNDGKNEILIHKKEHIPGGFKRGRINAAFNDPNNQKKFALQRNIEKHKKNMKKAWASGKYANRDTTNIGKNQNWTEERKARHREMALNRKKICCPYCNKYFSPAMASRWHFNNCKEKLNE